MTGPLDRPRWQALEIGPGGLPPESIRPRSSGAPISWPARDLAAAAPPMDARALPPPVAPGFRYPDPSDLPPAWQQWSAAAGAPEPPRRRALRGPARKIAAAAAALCVLVGLALWGNSARPLGGARGGAAVGDCLSSTGRQIDGRVACGDAAADFLVVGRYPDTGDAGECSASPADLAVVQSGPTLLCLNYVAVTGDCLLLGRQAGPVGKVACDSGTIGEYRVRAVLKNSIDADGCPAGTTQSLVHRYNSEVLCLVRS